MEDRKKAAIALGLVGGIGTLLYLTTRVKAVPPPEVTAATVQIEVIGAESHSPVTLKEGESYTVRVTVTNQSTRAGVPVEATLGVGITSVTELGYVLIPGQESSEHFAPNETKTFDYTMDVPSDIGQSGSIVAWVTDPAGADIVSATERFTITMPEIVYGATIAIGV